MVLIRVYITFIIFKLVFSYSLSNQLILDFLKIKHASFGTILSCSRKQEQINLVKHLIFDNLQISYHNIEKISCETVLPRDRQVSVILDAQCNHVQPFLQKCATLRFFYHSYHWLIFASTPMVIQIFQNTALSINTNLNVALAMDENQNGSVTNWTILDMYNPGYNNNGQLIVKHIGYYTTDNNSSNPNVMQNKVEKLKNRKNMTNTHLRSVIVIPENISISLEEYMANEKERYNNSYTRYQTVLLRNCQDFFNFSMSVHITHSWGYDRPNGEVDGLLKEFNDSTADFALTPVMFKAFRLKIIDYMHGSWILRLAFIFRHPKTTATSYQLFIRPLVFSVWLCIFATLLLMVIVLRLTVCREIKAMKTNNSGGETSWSFFILYGVGEICQQGLSYVPLLPSGRIVIFVVVLFSFLIYQFYSASLVSFLLLQPPRTINTLLDLLNSPLKVGCEDTAYDKYYFSITTDPVAKAMFQTKMTGSHNTTNFISLDEGLRNIKSGSYAFHTISTSAYWAIEKRFTEKLVCELAEVQMYPTQILHGAIQKHSPFKKMFDQCLVRQREVGVMDRLMKYWDSRKPVCLDPTNYMEVTVNLQESYWALIVFGLGIVLSLIVLVLELIFTRKRKALNNIFKKIKLKAMRPFLK